VTSSWGSTRAGKEEQLLEEKPEPQRNFGEEKTGEITFLKLVKIQNSEVNPEDEQQDCICSGFKSEEQILCDKPSKDFYGTVKNYSAKNMIHSTLCIMFFVKFTFLQRSYFCPSV